MRPSAFKHSSRIPTYIIFIGSGFTKQILQNTNLACRLGMKWGFCGKFIFVQFLSYLLQHGATVHSPKKDAGNALSCQLNLIYSFCSFFFTPHHFSSTYAVAL